MAVPFFDKLKEEWNYIFRVFPLIDLPFNVLQVALSEHWLYTLIIAILFPVIASSCLYICGKRGVQPGPWILTLNGALFFLYAWVSGPGSPTWLSLINVTVGSSYMFNKAKWGQIGIAICSVGTGLLFYWMGADPVYSLTIVLILCTFTLLFSRSHSLLLLQRQRVEDRKQEITDSINYAKKIQLAVLPNEEVIRAGMHDSFISYLPRDIVSGDFYWHHEIDKDNYIFVCADCTGHGVPGAFMTVIGSSLLSQIVTEKRITKPSIILEELDKGIVAMLKQHADQQGVIQDGMDLSLIKVNKSIGEFVLTSAKRPALLIRNGKIRELKGSKFTLGGIRSGEKHFEEIVVKYEKNDMLYLFTDGYVDQFGGQENKKYMIKRFRSLVTEIHTSPVAAQKQRLESAHVEWKGKNEQTDDVLVVGIRF